MPALYLAVAVLMFWQLPADGLGRDRLRRPGLLIGAAVGWQRGKMMHIHVDPETHALNQKASPAAMFFLIVADRRSHRRARLLGHGRAGVSPAMLTDPLIAFALGMFTLTRLEMYLRAKRLLEEARGRRLMTDERRFYEAPAAGRASFGARGASAIANRSPRFCANGCRRRGLVLEIASGTGEHAVYFAEAFPALNGSRATSIPTRWHRSRPGANCGLANLRRAAGHRCIGRPTGRSIRPMPC